MDENRRVREKFMFPQNNLVVTSIDIQSVEPVDQRTRDSLQKSVQLAIEITTNSQEAAARCVQLLLTGGRCQVCLVISQEAAARCVQLLLTGGCSQVASSDWTPCPLVDSIWTIMFVWRLKEKSVRTVVCCVCCVWQLYTMIHTCEQFLQLIVDVGFFLCVFSHGLNFLCEYGYFVFCVLLLSFISSVLVNRLARKNMSEIT